MSLSFPASPSVGQVYQGWQWNGAAWDPSYASQFVLSVNGQKGNVTGLPQLLATNNVVNAAQCQFILPVANYKRYQIRFDGMVLFTGGSNGIIQLSNNNGSSWDSALHYDWTTTFASTTSANASTNGSTGGVASNAVFLFGALDMSASGSPGTGIVDFTVGAFSEGVAQTYWRSGGSTSYVLCTGWENPLLSNPNAIRLVGTLGNVTVNASLYGYPS